MKKFFIVAIFLLAANLGYADQTKYVAEELNIANPQEGAKGLRKRYIHKHHQVKKEEEENKSETIS